MSEDKIILIGLQKFDGLETLSVKNAGLTIEFDVKGNKAALRKASAQILFGVTTAEFQGHQIKLQGESATWCNDSMVMKFKATYDPS